jgi:hypothetical protein
VSSDLVVAKLGAGGSTGSGLARNIARAGIGVRAWNRTRAAAEPLAGDGAAVTGSPLRTTRAGHERQLPDQRTGDPSVTGTATDRSRAALAAAQPALARPVIAQRPLRPAQGQLRSVWLGRTP